MKPSDVEASRPVVELDAYFGETAIMVGSWTWSRESLSPRFCSLLCMAADIATAGLGLPYEMHVFVALENGADGRTLHEVVNTVSPWAGYCQGLLALKSLCESLKTRGVAVPESSVQALAPEVSALLEAYGPNDAEAGGFLVTQMFRHWTRSGLTTAERALLTIGVHVCLHTLGETFELAIRLARAAGATNQEILSVVRFVAEYGWARSLDALQRIRERRLLD